MVPGRQKPRCPQASTICGSSCTRFVLSATRSLCSTSRSSVFRSTMSDNPTSMSAGDDASQTTPAGQTSPPKDQSDQSTAQLNVQHDDPAMSLRQKALLTLRRKPLAPSHAPTAAPTLPQRPVSDTPTITLDYGQEEPSVATSAVSKPSNGLPSSTSTTHPTHITASESIPIMPRSDPPKKPEQPPPAQPSTAADISMREEGEISDEEPEPEPKPPPKAPASRKETSKSTGNSSRKPKTPPPPPPTAASTTNKAQPPKAPTPKPSVVIKAEPESPRPSLASRVGPPAPVSPAKTVVATSPSSARKRRELVLDEEHVRPGLSSSSNYHSLLSIKL